MRRVLITLLLKLIWLITSTTRQIENDNYNQSKEKRNLQN